MCNSYNSQLCLSHGYTMSACLVTYNISLIIINVWNGNTTCQLLPMLPSYYVLKITNLIAQLKSMYIIEIHIFIHI